LPHQVLLGGPDRTKTRARHPPGPPSRTLPARSAGEGGRTQVVASSGPAGWSSPHERALAPPARSTQSDITGARVRVVRHPFLRLLGRGRWREAPEGEAARR